MTDGTTDAESQRGLTAVLAELRGRPVVLASDALAQPPAKATDIVVETTIFDGKVVYTRATESND